MANLADKSGDAYSNLVQGKGTGSLSFPMPGTVVLDVESVVATIDNSAGAATTATLVVRDSSGEVIATKRMGDTFPAGETGTVTFSLRNADSGVGIRFDIENVGRFLHVTTTQDVDFEVLNFFVNATGVGSTVDIEAESSLNLVGRDQFNLESSGAWLISVDSVVEAIATICGITVGSGGWSVDTTGPITLDTSHGSDLITLRIPNGASVEVQDAADNPIFRVNSDGSLQGKTGKALTFNL